MVHVAYYRIARHRDRGGVHSGGSATAEKSVRDFKISAKISDFARISGEISRFHVISGTLRGAGTSATECNAASTRVCMREVKGIC